MCVCIYIYALFSLTVFVLLQFLVHFTGITDTFGVKYITLLLAFCVTSLYSIFLLFLVFFLSKNYSTSPSLNWLNLYYFTVISAVIVEITSCVFDLLRFSYKLALCGQCRGLRILESQVLTSWVICHYCQYSSVH